MILRLINRLAVGAPIPAPKSSPGKRPMGGDAVAVGAKPQIRSQGL
jgi:hypothetical protein